jgi:hypothetical protein
MSKGKHAQAYKALLKFRGSPILAARELFYIHAQMEQEELLIAQSGVAVNANFFTRMVELFTIPRIRRAAQASGIVMIAQQMCGSKFISGVPRNKEKAGEVIMRRARANLVHSQHHRLLLFHCLRASRRNGHRRTARLVGLRNNQLPLCLAGRVDH